MREITRGERDFLRGLSQIPLKPLEAHPDGPAAVVGIGKSVIPAGEYLQVLGGAGRSIQGFGVGEGDDLILLAVQEQAGAYGGNGLSGIVFYRIVIKGIL